MKKMLIVAVMLSLCACASGGKQSATDFNPADHFLGGDYAKLQAAPERKGGLGWRSPEFKAADYTAMYIEPVKLWNAENMVKESGGSLGHLAKFFPIHSAIFAKHLS